MGMLAGQIGIHGLLAAQAVVPENSLVTGSASQRISIALESKKTSRHAMLGPVQTGQTGNHGVHAADLVERASIQGFGNA